MSKPKPRAKPKPRPSPAPPRPSRAEVVRVALARRNWSQRDLAVALDVSPQRVNDVLSGKRPASDDWWARVALALEVPFVDLGITRADVTRPAAELELVRYAPGNAPTTLVPWGDEAEALADRLGLLTPIGPGDLLALLSHAERAKVSVRIRMDQPPLG